MHGDVTLGCSPRQVWSLLTVAAAGLLLVTADEDRNVSVVQDVVTDRAQERAAHLPLPSGACHDA